MQKNATLKRGAYSRAECVFIGAWVPEAWVSRLDLAVMTEDSDRSKFLRMALREKLSRTRTKDAA
ncbi:MAG: hypothetical protein FD161_2998 [Limisphaerales bacterium]|nr:MAG: hypothetical protein FD161_2998 [Limisphaerales bacterium]KAG0508111.1 MAG: hypothetical protein E1N63_2705 [Limisphaerales bacterium]TXT53036.1 MAG: hypothetical protein FD140_144 [Limisphaerales bacterium]